jgi:chromate transporter
VIDISEGNMTEADAGHGISFGEAFRVWLRVALLSFRPGRTDRRDASHSG